MKEFDAEQSKSDNRFRKLHVLNHNMENYPANPDDLPAKRRFTQHIDDEENNSYDESTTNNVSDRRTDRWLRGYNV